MEKPLDDRLEDRMSSQSIVSRDPEVHSGDLVFSGTRVPVDTLIDYLKHGRSVDEFLNGFPSVERWQVDGFLDLSAEAVEAAEAQSASTPG